MDKMALTSLILFFVSLFIIKITPDSACDGFKQVAALFTLLTIAGMLIFGIGMIWA
jgi:hypothetical protein